MSGSVDEIRLSMPRLATRLGFSPDTIRRWYKKNLFPRPHYIGGRRFWYLRDVRKWERAHVRAQFEGMTL